jgi:nucleoid DNA-binding protein
MPFNNVNFVKARMIVTLTFSQQRRINMATLIQAIQTYGPRVQLHPTAQLDEVSDWMAARTGANKNEALMLLHELTEAVLYHSHQGKAVNLPGLGIFSPAVDRSGNFRIRIRIDPRLQKGITATQVYLGQMVNREHIGFTGREYKLLWDADHPDDPLELNGSGNGHGD